MERTSAISKTGPNPRFPTNTGVRQSDVSAGRACEKRIAIRGSPGGRTGANGGNGEAGESGNQELWASEKTGSEAQQSGPTEHTENTEGLKNWTLFHFHGLKVEAWKPKGSAEGATAEVGAKEKQGNVGTGEYGKQEL
ncbi:MAG: hypothetical protein ACKOE8_04230, partial [Opitutaceae bacterium]